MAQSNDNNGRDARQMPRRQRGQPQQVDPQWQQTSQRGPQNPDPRYQAQGQHVQPASAHSDSRMSPQGGYEAGAVDDPFPYEQSDVPFQRQGYEPEPQQMTSKGQPQATRQTRVATQGAQQGGIAQAPNAGERSVVGNQSYAPQSAPQEGSMYGHGAGATGVAETYGGYEEGVNPPHYAQDPAPIAYDQHAQPGHQASDYQAVQQPPQDTYHEQQNASFGGEAGAGDLSQTASDLPSLEQIYHRLENSADNGAQGWPAEDPNYVADQAQFHEQPAPQEGGIVDHGQDAQSAYPGAAAGEYRGSQTTAPDYNTSEQIPHGQQGHQGQQQDALFYPEEDAEAYQHAQEERRPRNRLAVVGLVLLGAIGAGAAIAYAFTQFGLGVLDGGGGKPKLVRADKSPSKVKPTGGRRAESASQNGKMIYDRIQGADKNSVARLAKSDDKIAAQLNSGSTSSTQEQAMRALAQQRNGSGSSGQSGSGVEPNKVKTFVVRPDGTIIQPMSGMSGMTATSGALSTLGTGVSAQDIQAAAQKDANAGAEAAARALRRQAEKSTSQANTAVQNTVQQTTAALSQPKPVQQVKQKATAVSSRTTSRPVTKSTSASSGSGKYAVQVAARRDQTSALEAFADLQQKYPSILGNYSPLIQRADLGGKGIFFRLRVGPMSSKSTASGLCGKLKSAGYRNCFVTRL